jgi:hypothetical protein
MAQRDPKFNNWQEEERAKMEEPHYSSEDSLDEDDLKNENYLSLKI